MEGKRILVVVAHPDDEVLGCGGLIARHVNLGQEVQVMSMTNGVSSRGSVSASAKEQRKHAAYNAANILGFKWSAMFDFPDNGLDSIPLLNVVTAIESVKTKFNPHVIYTHFASDLNVDHRIVYEAAITAFRPQPGEIWEEIRSFEIPSSTDWGLRAFSPDTSVDITAQWDLKKQALLAYGSEMRTAPHSRSLDGIEALAAIRGHQAGFEKAEAFITVRRRFTATGVF